MGHPAPSAKNKKGNKKMIKFDVHLCLPLDSSVFLPVNMEGVRNEIAAQLEQDDSVPDYILDRLCSLGSDRGLDADDIAADFKNLSAGDIMGYISFEKEDIREDLEMSFSNPGYIAYRISCTFDDDRYLQPFEAEEG